MREGFNPCCEIDGEYIRELETEVEDLAAIRPAHTKPSDAIEVGNVFEEFMSKYHHEGINLRMEKVSGLTGQRLTIVFNWEDMG